MTVATAPLFLPLQWLSVAFSGSRGSSWVPRMESPSLNVWITDLVKCSCIFAAVLGTFYLLNPFLSSLQISCLTLYEDPLYHVLIAPPNITISHLITSNNLLLGWHQLPLDDGKFLLNIVHVYNFGSHRLSNNCTREMNILKQPILLYWPISLSVLVSGKVICRYFRIVWLIAW